MNKPATTCCAALSMLLASLLVSSSACASLYAVAYDRTLNHQSLVRVSSSDASVVDDAMVALPGCCRANGALVASDDTIQTAYFVTPGSNPSLAWTLHRISLANGSAISTGLPAGEHIAAILRRPSTATLFALSDNGSGLRLATISDAGTVSDFGVPILANCCAVRVGVAALSADGSKIAFVARLKASANDPALRFIVVSTATGTLISNALIAHAPDVLVASGSSEFAAIYHDAGTEHFGLIGSDGTITPVGTGLSACCDIFAGISARSGSQLRLIARNLGESDFSLFELNTITGAFSSIGVLPTRYVINGLVESNVVLGADLIFRDGFETLASPARVETAEGATAAKLDDMQLGGVSPLGATTDTASSPRVQGTIAPDVGSTQSVRVRGNLPPAIAVPLGNVFIWMILSVLLAAAALLYRRIQARMR